MWETVNKGARKFREFSDFSTFSQISKSFATFALKRLIRRASQRFCKHSFAKRIHNLFGNLRIISNNYNILSLVS